jgi:hypothetical protein
MIHYGLDMRRDPPMMLLSEVRVKLANVLAQFYEFAAGCVFTDCPFLGHFAGSLR